MHRHPHCCHRAALPCAAFSFSLLKLLLFSCDPRRHSGWIGKSSGSEVLTWFSSAEPKLGLTLLRSKSVNFTSLSFTVESSQHLTCLLHNSQLGFCGCWVRLTQQLHSPCLPVSRSTMQPARVKSSFAEDVKLLSNILPSLSAFFCVKLRLKLQVLEGSHGGEQQSPECWTFAVRWRDVCSVFTALVWLYHQVSALTGQQGVKLCWHEAHQWSFNAKSSQCSLQTSFQRIYSYIIVHRHSSS